MLLVASYERFCTVGCQQYILKNCSGFLTQAMEPGSRWALLLREHDVSQIGVMTREVIKPQSAAER
jgi:hypothetical protein